MKKIYILAIALFLSICTSYATAKELTVKENPYSGGLEPSLAKEFLQTIERRIK